MKTYTTILIDINNIGYELYNSKYLPRYEKEILEKMIKNGISSLQGFELIAIVGNNANCKTFISKNHLKHIETVSKEKIQQDREYIEYSLRCLDRTKKETLVVSGNKNMLINFQMLGFDTCYFSFSNNSNELDINPTISVKKLEELASRHPNIQEKEEITSVTSHSNYYIDSKALEVLRKNEVILIKEFNPDIDSLKKQDRSKGTFIVTMDLLLAMELKRKGCTTYFVNNHYNDDIDFIADVESSVEEFPKHLVKILEEYTK